MTDISKYLSVTERDYNALAGADWPSYNRFIQHYDVPAFVYQEIDEAQSKVETFNNPAFCVLPFYGMEYPLNKECCLMDYSVESIDSVKQKMLEGTRSDACKKCWTLEDKGIVSDRIIKNNHVDVILDKDLKVIENECNLGNYDLLHYKIDTDNTCNAACITCDGAFSTHWITLEKKQGLSINKPWSLSLNELNINYQKAKSINFRGGESLLSKSNFEILRKLIENKNTDCFVSFTTNGSIKLNQTQIEILSHFKKLNFCLSIDGIGSKFEYLRYPLKWNSLLENIEQYKQLDIDLSASFTLSNINMMYYSETVEWFRANKIAYLNNIVYNPNYFSPGSLPKKIKEKIIDKNNLIFISTHNDQDDLLFQQFLVKIQEQDSLKNIRMQDYVPEFYNLIKEYL